eukprot:4787860-Pleurochrysis_carterae.AAC.1
MTKAAAVSTTTRGPTTAQSAMSWCERVQLQATLRKRHAGRQVWLNSSSLRQKRRLLQGG